MFYSVGNNFGAGPIKFREARESNFIVLNAEFKVDSRNADYAAAEVLEIYVPDLNIARSTETGVVMYFENFLDWYGTIYNNSSGVAVKSWIKDKNTICIEKLPYFDDKEEVTFFIQSMYCQLGQGSNTILVTKLPLSDASAEGWLEFSSGDSLIVVEDDWIFMHVKLDRCQPGHASQDWDALFENMPSDISAVVPFLHTAYWNGENFTGCARVTIENQHFSVPYTERSNSLTNSNGDPFVFAFLVRGDNE